MSTTVLEKPEVCSINDNDESLVRAFLDGNHDAFNKLVLKYQNKMVSFCYYKLGHYEEAVDTAQEIFIKLYKSAKTFQFRASFKTWLYRIAMNVCYTKKKKSILSIDTVPLMDFLKTEGNNERFSEDKIVINERNANIYKVINNLPDKYKEVIILKYIEGYTNKEIVEILQSNENTVKSRLLRAHKIFRDKWRRRRD